MAERAERQCAQHVTSRQVPALATTIVLGRYSRSTGQTLVTQSGESSLYIWGTLSQLGRVEARSPRVRIGHSVPIRQVVNICQEELQRSWVSSVPQQ